MRGRWSSTPVTMRHLRVAVAPSLPQELIRRMLGRQDVEGAARVYALVDPRWRAADPASQLDGGFDVGLRRRIEARPDDFGRGFE